MEYSLMNVFGREGSSASHDNLAALFLPLENGTRADTQLPPHFYWN